MKQVKNERTGKMDVQFSAKLISIASEENKQINSNGKEYYPCTIDFVDAKGVDRRATAIMYAANKAHGVQVSKFYLATAAQAEDGNVFIQLSHLEGGGTRATADMFSFEPAKESVKLTA